jgi:hypothetical protein
LRFIEWHPDLRAKSFLVWAENATYFLSICRLYMDDCRKGILTFMFIRGLLSWLTKATEEAKRWSVFRKLWDHRVWYLVLVSPMFDWQLLYKVEVNLCFLAFIQKSDVYVNLIFPS